LHSLLESLAAPDYIILPKCDSPAFISMVRSLLDLAAKQTEIIALIESAKGVEALPDIVSSDVRPVALLFGAADMEAGLGAKTGSGKRCYLSDRASSRPPGSAGECSSSEPAVKNRIMIANVHASQGETG
jgi:citrate lyase beta subunit